MENRELHAHLKMTDMELYLIPELGEYQLLIIDTKRNQQVIRICTPEEAAAIGFLIINGDDVTTWITDAMYKLASPICDELPDNLRPIP